MSVSDTTLGRDSEEIILNQELQRSEDENECAILEQDSGSEQNSGAMRTQQLTVVYEKSRTHD